ncbi:methenyltetrahydrofolate synthase domain-containing protein [Linepithema humile]|uniref:methenyltetrahydrofolate synthase domain-containing protein n=1 Tax=Linepithema humile TaxID=83485 RepID=UPI0006237067|nr:PREDICTED: methenyltetrahydrofolate synthase domain-containing protein [Linepithema humile]XP_012234404.1 PREDICTED: methenyltetrahydrofolate synthase domain-containing protein [Linepithema humile]
MTEILPEELTKSSFRQKIWDYMTKNELVNFPVNIYKRIPNFKGAAEAAQRLAELDEFKKAKIIKINPDKPQEPVRLLALEANKEIIVPIPRLRSGLFLHVTPVAGATKEQLKILASMPRLTFVRGLEQTGKPLGLDSHIKVDLVVLGSVCVSRDGYRLGKGEGFADLEFAMMMRMGTITKNTIVITTVHDCQIVDYLPPQLFKDYDVPVDIIVTPTQTIFVEPRLKKPSGILWHMLSERRVKTMQVLQQLKEMDEKDGKIVVLKEVDSDVDTRHYVKNRIKYPRSKKRFNTKKDVENSTAENGKDKIDKPRFSRKRIYKKVEAEEENNPNAEIQITKVENNSKSAPRRRKNFRKTHIDFSLKLSNISSGVRVRDLKNALLERGVKPSEISWRGRGICYLHFSKLRSETALLDQSQVDSIVANLQQLRIGESANDEENFIVVEPDFRKPISRIEVTDVTTV